MVPRPRKVCVDEKTSGWRDRDDLDVLTIKNEPALTECLTGCRVTGYSFCASGVGPKIKKQNSRTQIIHLPQVHDWSGVSV